MARVTFISLYDLNASGIRLMSANLKKHGHQCDVIFLKRYNIGISFKVKDGSDEYPWIGIDRRGRTFKYAATSDIHSKEMKILRQTLAKLQPDIIGISVNTPMRSYAIRVTQYIKKYFDIPVVWGGYDPTVNFIDCVEHYDYACVGEGDQTILEIAKRIDEGQNIEDVCNLVYSKNGSLKVNPMHPLEPEIDKYPWRDNSSEDKYLIEDQTIKENYTGINDKPKGTYLALSARGCPFKCTYCCEATFKALYKGQTFLRRRSPQDIIAELSKVKKEFNLSRIQFEDEIFAINLKWLEEFVPMYKKEIGLPFTAYIYPFKDSEQILTLLKDAGLDFCCLALESGSERINKDVFGRVYNRELFIKTAGLCKKLNIKFYTDVITYNPYEEEEDLKKTLDVLIEIGGGFGMCINKLFVLPGTKIFQVMKKDGVNINDVEKREALFDFYCRLFWISSFTGHTRLVVNFIEKVKIFRKYPYLLNPALLNTIFHPISSNAELAWTLLPEKIKNKMAPIVPAVKKIIRLSS